MVRKKTGMRNMVLASSSRVYGSGYLVYLHEVLKELFSGCKEILFVPYARPGGISCDAYTAIAVEGLRFLDAKITGLHEYSNPTKAMEAAEAIFVGGGNTFVLVDALHDQGMFPILKNKIDAGMPYLGISAGTNICGVTMQTTNDMPIVKPISYKTLACLPFNINAHFIPKDPFSTHQGETRETRIQEFHAFQNIPVLGLQEGSWLRVKNEEIALEGNLNAYWFEAKQTTLKCAPRTVFPVNL